MANFCNNCGTALAANAQFCGSCGTPVAAAAPQAAPAPAAPPPVPPPAPVAPAAPAYAPPPQQPYYAPPPPASTNSSLPWIIAGVVVLLLGAAVTYLFLTRDKPGTAATTEASTATATPAETPAVGGEVLKYVTSQTNIRNIATAQGPNSRVVGTLSRGQQVRGTMHQGLSGDSYWFKLTDGRGYVSAINLSDGPPGPETAATAAVRAPLPNGTYCSVVTSSGNLRIRNSPGGAVIGAMPRGSRFQAFDQQYDRAGYTWIHIQPIDGRYPIGWVLSSYIAC